MPSEFGQLVELSTLDLGFNVFEGPLPSTLKALAKLSKFEFSVALNRH